MRVKIKVENEDFNKVLDIIQESGEEKKIKLKSEKRNIIVTEDLSSDCMLKLTLLVKSFNSQEDQRFSSR